MSSRIRSTFTSCQVAGVRPVNKENIPHVPEGTKNALIAKPAKRPALGEATNTLLQQQNAVNAAAKRTLKVEKSVTNVDKPKVIVKPTISTRNPIRPKLACLRPPETSTVSTSKSVSKLSCLPVPLPASARSNTLTRKVNVVKAVESLPLAKLKISSKEKEEEPLPDFSKIEDIDANDHDRPFLVSPYVNEIYDYLRTLEKKYPIQENHLEGSIITSTMRSTLVSWLVEVQVQYRLTAETLHQTIYIIDRYLQNTKDLPKSKLQLVGVTAMFIAAKYEETYCPDVEAYVFISDNAFTSKEVLMMERKMVKTLDFGINRPLSIHFLRRYSKVYGALPLIHSYGKYFIELALLDYSLAHIPPSRLAAAATFISLSVEKNRGFSNSSTWTDLLHYHSKYSYNNIKPVVQLLAKTLQNVAVSKKMQVVKRKYSQECFLRVSVLPAIQPAHIKELAEK